MAVVTYCLERHDWSPALGSNTTILTIADWFFKAAPFVAFPNLPTALETDKILTQHVFSLNGIPQGIVSDRGPHFTSQVWREICSELGAQVSLSIGFPQTNGQAERAKQERTAPAWSSPRRLLHPDHVEQPVGVGGIRPQLQNLDGYWSFSI